MTSLAARNPQAMAARSDNTFSRYIVYVTGIDATRAGLKGNDPRGLAQTVDTFGVHRQIGVSSVVGSGTYPQVGETWVVDQSLGTWTFLSKQVPVTPVVPTVFDLGPALEQLGLIEYTGPTSHLIMVRQVSTPITLSATSPTATGSVPLSVGNYIVSGNLLITNSSKAHQHTVEIWISVDNPANATVAGSYSSAIELASATDEDSLTIGPAVVMVTQPVNFLVTAQRDNTFGTEPVVIAAATTGGRSGCSSIVIERTFFNTVLV